MRPNGDGRTDDNCRSNFDAAVADFDAAIDDLIEQHDNDIINSALNDLGFHDND